MVWQMRPIVRRCFGNASGAMLPNSTCYHGPMHVAVFSDYYLPTLGGIQTSIKAQKTALEARGHRVTIFCPLSLPSTDPDIVRLPTLKYLKPDGFPVAGTTKRVVAAAIRELQSRPDIGLVHVHSDMAAGVAGLLAAKAVGLPAIQSMHGREDVYVAQILPLPDLTSAFFAHLHSKYISHREARINPQGHNVGTITARRIWRLMVSQSNFADHVIVPSRHFAEKLLDHGVTKPLTVHSNGLEDSVFEQLPIKQPRFVGANEDLRVMWCARFSPEKWPLALLEAAGSFPPGVSVDMYGDGMLFKKAQAYLRRHGLAEKVTLHGAVSQADVLAAMETHHLIINTSDDFENQPMTLLEAIAAGLPALYCDPDLGELLPAAGSVLAASAQPSSIAAAVTNLRAHPEAITAMSQAVSDYRDCVRQSHSIDALIELYARVGQK